MLSHPADDAADQEGAELGKAGILQWLLLRHPRQQALAVAGRQSDQGVEVGFLAFEPAVERADGGANLGAQGVDRQFGEAALSQHVGARPQQRGRHLAASLLPGRRDAREIQIDRSRLHPDIALLPWDYHNDNSDYDYG